jgi:hypothetical protein
MSKETLDSRLTSRTTEKGMKLVLYWQKKKYTKIVGEKKVRHMY